MDAKILYRYEIGYRNADDDTSIILREYKVVRETELTYFIEHMWRLKQVRKEYVPNAFAHDTKEDAKEHFIRRTNTRIRWYAFWKEECEKGLELIKDIKE